MIRVEAMKGDVSAEQVVTLRTVDGDDLTRHSFDEKYCMVSVPSSSNPTLGQS